MKKPKIVLPLTLAAFLIVGVCLIIANNNSEAEIASDAKQKTMPVYTNINLTFDKPEGEEYECTVSDNEKDYLYVDAYNEGDHYWLTVDSKKATPKSKKPTITIYKDNSGKREIIKKYQITVSPVQKVEMEDIKINSGAGREILLINPYELKEYELKYNNKIIKITQVLYDGDKCYYNLQGLKNGKTKVKAYLSETRKFVGSFTVTVGDYKAFVKEEYNNITLYYNPHMTSDYLKNGNIDIGKIIGNYHPDTVYSVKADNPELIGYKENHADETTPKSVIMFTKNIGKTKVAVYEKTGEGKTEKIGFFNLTVNMAKDSEVYASNKELDNDGIFYENFISPGDKYDLKNAVVSRYINSDFTNSHFSESEYTFTAKSNHPEIISVDKNGVCKCHTMDKNAVHRITYTVTFKDGSKITNDGAFDIVDSSFSA